MGNSATKEQRPPNPRLGSTDPQNSFSPAGSGPTSPTQASFMEQYSRDCAESSTEGRHVRPEFLASMGMTGEEERVPRSTEWRKETKQEREAKRLERERIARAKERERSMREEHVDGGYLVTQGIYTGTEDFNKGIVRQFMIERRIAPFWRGLDDHKESWTENQLVAAAKGLPIPAPDEIPKDEDEEPDDAMKPTSDTSSPNIESLTLPITTRSQSQNSETSSNHSSSPQNPLPQVSSASSSIGSALAKGRSKTIATLTSSAKAQTPDMKPKEIGLPKDPNVSGQRLEAYLYKDATECPICFLYYPPYLNKTRCCDQGMCSECFVQIKRPDPHPPEHPDPSATPPPQEELQIQDGEFVSEPATCPFCKVSEFGITYDAPPFRRGLAYANHPSGQIMNRSFSGMSSSSSLASAGESNGSLSQVSNTRRRTTSVSAMSPSVICTDQIRPEWLQKLEAARTHARRRGAAATALHTAAYLMGSRGHDDGRSFAGFGRRGLLRRTSGGDNLSHGVTQYPQNMLAFMSERNARTAHGEAGLPPGGHADMRRGRLEDLEDFMMMEAIRMSLASEDERKKREEKESKKEAKKKEKEARKAGKEEKKAAKRAGLYPRSANASTSAFQEASQTSAKGKEQLTDYGQCIGDGVTDFLSPSANPQSHLERARAQIQGEGPSSLPAGFYNPTPFRPSHLRTQSNVSSSASSLEGGSAPGSLQDPREPGSSLDVSPAGSRVNIPGAGLTPEPFISGTPPGSGAGHEPMFNFRSLAAMVGDDDDYNGEAQQATQDGGAGGAASQHESGSTAARAKIDDDLPAQTGGEVDHALKTPNQKETMLGASQNAIS